MIKKYAWLIPVVLLAVLVVLWARSLNKENTSPNPTALSQDSEIQLEENPLSPPSLVAEADGPSGASKENTIKATASLTATFEPLESTAEIQSNRTNKVGRGPYRILGTVTSIAMAPIDEATVTCRALPGFMGKKGDPFTVVTQNGGQFVFGFFEPGNYELTAQKSGYALGGARVELTIPGPEVVEIILRPGDIIEGTIRENLTGIALSDVTIWAQAERRVYSRDEMRPQQGRTTKSGVNGSYLLEGLLPDITYTLIVADREHAPERRSGIKPGGVPVDFHLNRGGKVSGRVVWENDGGPVEGAHVSLGYGRGFLQRIPGLQAVSQNIHSATTLADGTFTIGGLPTMRRLPLSALYEEELESGPATYRSEPEWVELSTNEHKTDVELVLSRRPPQRLFGVVRDLDRHPIAGARVSLHFGMSRSRRGGGSGRWTQNMPSESLLDEVSTDTQGNYEFDLPFPGPRRVEVEKKGYYARPEGSDTLMVSPRTAEYELNFVLFPGQALSGMVKGASSGKPVPKVEMRLRSEAQGERSAFRTSRALFEEETVSDRSGRYEFPSVAAGAYKLRVLEAPSGYALPAEPFSITIEEDEPAEFDVPLPEGVSISGTVLYPDGRYASGARVVGYTLTKQSPLSDESDPVGRYSLSAFPIDSEVRLVVWPLDFPDLNPAPLITDRMTLSESLEEFELKVPEAAIALVHVTSSEEKPLRGQTVEISYAPEDPLDNWDPRLPARFERERTTNGKGTARFTRLAPGSWKIFIKTRKDPIESVFYAREADTVEVSVVIPVESLVDNSGVLAGTVRFEDGSPAEGVRVQATMQGDNEGIETGTEESARTNSKGAFHIRGLRKGKPFNVEIRSRRASKTFNGIVTNNRELDFVLPNAGGLHAKVLDAQGDPPVRTWTAYLFQLEDGGNRPVFSQPETEPAYGWVQWNELAAGTYQILVSGPEIPRAYSEVITVQPDEVTEGVEIRLPESVHFTGEVVDANSGEGIAGVEVVEIFDSGTPGSRWSQFLNQRRVYTDSSGDFLMGDLPQGHIHVRLIHPNYEKTDFELESIPSSEARIQMQPNSSE